jgi:dephospho-CoA kinase
MQSKNRPKKILLGVTGGIGSGKTVVCKFLKQMGCSIYHADDIAKRLYKNNVPLKKKLIKSFGTGVLDNKKRISLLKLRKVVFSSKLNERRVGMIVHPFVISEIMKSIDLDRKSFIVVEAALIFETNFDKYLNYTILVYSNIKKRVKRVVKRNNITETDVKQIIKLQMPEKEKIKKADFVVYNNGSINELKRNVRLVFKAIKSIWLLKNLVMY